MTETLRKFAVSAVSTEGLADKRQVLVRISSETVDRQDDIVVQAGLLTSSFMSTGGTVLWQHDAGQPIARCVSISRDGAQTSALAQFPDAGVSAKADEIYGLIKAQVISSASIGFKPLEWEPIDPKNPWGGQRYMKTELMEFSFVSVPANADATVIARSHRAKADEAWKVGASRNLPLGGDEAWDGPGAEASIFAHCGFDGEKPDLAMARKGFLAYDSAAPKLKGSYKLPFAKMIDGRLTAMPSGIRAAASRLPQSDIPDDVEASARAVLDHYEAKMESDKAALAAEIRALLPDDERAQRDPLALVKELAAAHKGGRVLSAANFEHVKCMQKCLSDMADCRTKALDSHGETQSQLQAFADHLNTAGEHAKALLKSARKKPEDDADADEPGDEDPDNPDPENPDDDVELAAAALRRKRLVEVAARAAV